VKKASARKAVPEQSGACKYARMCRHYRSENYTCGDEDEAWTYCGTYDVFASFKPVVAAVEQ
jgi:hypothetical protein